MTMIDLEAWEQRFITYVQAHLHNEDGAHDLKHFHRVWKTSRYINEQEGNVADNLVLLAAAYFHDFVTVPKNHPDRSKVSKLSADKTKEILANDFPDFPKDKIDDVAHAVHAHSFSAAVTPETPEAKILQDADRMEAIGAIGLARVFYIAGLMKSSLFEANDPFAKNRELNDSRYAIDHFPAKLLKLPAMMNTKTGKALGEKNAAYLQDFLHKLSDEIEGNWSV
ncbi:MAG: phosphohydrolase [Filimonas sp.]|nr:phosphohydrolase [Filimonas sp.]